MDKQLEFITLDTLFNSDDRYIIPIYQRNYAWTYLEIQQLLSDLLKASDVSSSAYFLGSLVVKKSKNQQKTYEVIDGQQRLTTLFLLNECLRLLYGAGYKGKSFHLSFEHRDESNKILEGLKEKDKLNIANLLEKEFGSHTIIDGIKSIENFVRDGDNGEKLCFLLKKNSAYLLRTELPSYIDENYYFEKMNTRGVQLEAHELLKAKMMDRLGAHKDLFALIWDACADMSRFVIAQLYSKFKPQSETKARKAFLKSKTFDEFKQLIGLDSDYRALQNSGGTDENVKADKRTIKSIVEGDSNFTNMDKEKSNDEKEGRYQSVINFPNFLLQVLSIYLGYPEEGEKIRLDDKFLLEEFGYAPKVTKGEKDKLKVSFDDSEEIEKFILHLLKMRYLFDRYVLKINDEKWDIWSWEKSEKNNYKQTFASQHKEITQLQSMLHVSFPTQTYKKWLLQVLCFLNKQNNESLGDEDFVKELEIIAAKLLKEQYPKEDDESASEQSGIIAHLKKAKYPNITHYTFNYLDYLIWKAFCVENNEKFLLPDETHETNEMVDGLKQAIKEFRFKHRSSVEHYYPGNPSSIPSLPDNELNSLGNLCLISGYQNLKLYNSSPNEKRQEVLSSLGSGLESAKQALMMIYEKWEESFIDEHQTKVLNLLEKELNKRGIA